MELDNKTYEEIKDYLSQLPPVQEMLLWYVFGFMNARVFSYEELSDKFDLGKDQVEAEVWSAVNKMKENEESYRILRTMQDYRDDILKQVSVDYLM